MNTIGLVVNPHKKGVQVFAGNLARWLLKNKKNVLLKKQTAHLIGMKKLSSAQYTFSDLLVVLGGDGTFLSAARAAAPRETPILGINMGGFGFLTETTPQNAKRALRRIFSGRFYIENRMMLQVCVYRNRKMLKSFCAFNDAVITKGVFSRLLRCDAWINNEYIASFPGDGVIVSTPTGSTAYSLSAGGPLADPRMSLLIVTPICPHTLYTRPLVVPENSVLTMRVFPKKEAREETMLTLDGQEGFSLKADDRVVIQKAPFVTKLVRVSKEGFYKKLRTKLKWGE